MWFSQCAKHTQRHSYSHRHTHMYTYLLIECWANNSSVNAHNTNLHTYRYSYVYTHVWILTHTHTLTLWVQISAAMGEKLRIRHVRQTGWQIINCGKFVGPSRPKVLFRTHGHRVGEIMGYPFNNIYSVKYEAAFRILIHIYIHILIRIHIYFFNYAPV